MIPTLYENATQATMNSNEGLGTLAETTTAQVVRDSNQFPVLTLTYPIVGAFAKDFDRDMVIVADMGLKDEEKAQAFRISSIARTQDGLTITAPHVLADLNNVKITQQVTNANCTPEQAWDALKAAFAYEMPMITFYSDVVKVANINWEMSDDSIGTRLIGEDQAGDTATNTFQALYGVDLYFNNYKLSMLANNEHYTGHSIKWNQNLSTFDEELNTDSYYDGIIPYAKFTPEEEPETGDGTEPDPYDGVGDVQYVGTGGATIYDSPYKGHNKVGTLKNGTYYHVKATKSENTVNDDTWYQLDDGSWIEGRFFTFDKSGAYVVNKVSAQGHVSIPDDDDSADGTYSDYTGVGTITYAGKGKVAVWNSPFSGHSLTGKYLANGTTWKIFSKANVGDDHVWYNLGGNQWVDGQYLSIQKTTDFVSTPTHGILQILKKPVSYTSPRMMKQTNWNPKVGSRWKISATATGPDDSTLYQVSTYIWVKDDDDTISFANSGQVQPNQDNDRKAVVRATGKIPIYSSPNGSRVTEHWVKVGEQHQIFAQAENNSRTWYEIGEGQWVDATYFNFDAADDVAPGDEDGDTGDDDGVEVEEQTVMLDEKYILANTAVHTEHPKLQVVDLSEYNVRDQDKLREVALAYMKEYRIGILPISMTISYQQLNDEYKYLSTVDLYDIVDVYVDELDISQQAKVNSVTWDCLLETYTTVTIGQMPIDYTHDLGNYIEQTNTKTKEQANKRATHLFGEMKSILKKTDGDQKAALQKFADEMNIAWKSNSNALDKLKDMITDINETVDDVQGWITGGGAGVIRAVPNWQNPTELTAETGNGGKMYFSGNGLGYIGSDGVLRSAIDSRGNVVAEAITGGTIKGVTLTGVTVDGNSYLRSVGDQYSTVMSSQWGFSVSDNNGGKAALNSHQLNIGGSYLVSSDIDILHRFFVTNGYKGYGLYFHSPKGGDVYLG